MSHISDKKILIIDNEDEILRLGQETLENGGFTEVRCAQDGVAGLEMALEWKPDLIISDIVHPGPDGLKIFEELCIAHPEHSPYFIVVTRPKKHYHYNKSNLIHIKYL